MKLSIITINYNNKEGLKKSIESVVTQTITDYEYIVIDGGSTDGSVDVIKDYINNQEHKKKLSYWISENDSGIYDAMNKGLRKASGDFCLFLNSGDWLIEHTTLECTLPLLLDRNVIYYTNFRNATKSNIGEIIFLPRNVDVNFFINCTLNHQNSFIPTKILIDNGLYNDKYKIVSDWAFYLKIAQETDTYFKYIDTVISVNETGGIGSRGDYQYIKDEEHRRVILELFPKLGNSLLKMREYENSLYSDILKINGKSRIFDFYLRIFKYFSRRINIIFFKLRKFKNENS